MNPHVTRSLIGLSLLCSAAQAQTNACLKQTINSENVQRYTNDQGNPASRLVEVGTALPGNEVIYFIAVTNICATPLENLVINETIPAHRTYMKTTAKGDGTDRIFSADGVNYARWDALTVKTPDGTSRAVHMADIKSIRWIFKTTLAPGETTYLRFHATVN